MNVLVAIRLECLRIAAGDEAKAKTLESFVRRGIARKDLQGAGCGGCAGRKPPNKRARTLEECHALLHSSAPALTGVRMQEMSVAQLITDGDLVFAQADADRIDAALGRVGLRRGMNEVAIGAWATGIKA